MKKIILIIIVVSLFLAGCQSGGTSSKEINYKTGVKEINLEFLGDKTAYQERPLTFFMRLNNGLAYNAENVKVSVVGLDEKYVELSNREESLGQLEGQSVFNPEGGIKNIEFLGGVKRLPRGTEKIDDDYFIYVDYFSKMDFNPTICISPVLYGIEDGGCKRSDGRSQKLSYSGQGAPLAVTEMEVISGDGQVMLILKLRNQGKGDVEEVIISQSAIGGKDLKCQFVNSKGETFSFTKDKKEAEMICEAVIGRPSTYETPVYIEFLYKYRLRLKQRLELKGSGITN